MLKVHQSGQTQLEHLPGHSPVAVGHKADATRATLDSGC